ncbi:hypothetical protein OIU84_004229 [Salix udensis]|uniref:Cell number regulator 6 n=1 Tax=Salix udensis TaxID=889485 RepID=A0AAD6P3Y7_9ROSI|nr:hypothetical protein OIU84_004229 [Salix udensis]
MNVGNPYLITLSLQQTSLGLLGFLDVLKTPKAMTIEILEIDSYCGLVLLPLAITSQTFGSDEFVNTENIESLREDTPWTTPCVCHGVCVEGGIALAAATALFHGIDPNTSFLICEGLLFAWWMCGIYTGLVRQSLQKKYHLKNSPCDPCMIHCCMHWCALCQEHREMKGRLSDNFVMPMTIVNPPPVQEMSAASENQDSIAAPEKGTVLEMQPL